MSNLYTLTATTHTLVQQLAKKEGIKIEIENKNKIFSPEWKCKKCGKIGVFDDFKFTICESKCLHCGYTENSLALEPLIDRLEKELPAIQPTQIYQILKAFKETIGKVNWVVGNPKYKVAGLYQKWSDFETGAFHRGDEGMVEVLTELNEILKNL